MEPVNIFELNHMGYIMSSRDTLRAYMVEALSIGGTFLDRFTHQHWTSALEDTLQYRPANVPTEHYLKSQRLWIMYKLLVSIGMRDAISNVMAATSPVVVAPQVSRAHFSSILDGVKYKLDAQVPLFQVLEDFAVAVEHFNATFAATLESEKQEYVNRRCEIIRWFSWVVCKGGDSWLRTAPLNVLLQWLHQWRTEPTLPEIPVAPAASALNPNSPVFSPRLPTKH